MDGFEPSSVSDDGGGDVVLPGLDGTGSSEQASAPASCTGPECDDEEIAGNDAAENETSREPVTITSDQCANTGDNDGDGVCDEHDACLNTPDGAAVLTSGCHLDRSAPLLLEGVEFAVASARLTEASRAALDQAVALLKANPKLPVSVDGHTDNSGSREQNRRLSQARAEAVYRYFIDQGVAADRLAYRGLGEDQPVAPNTFEDGRDYPAGRARNRRVELSVLSQEKFAAVSQQNAERERARRLALEAEKKRQLEAQRQESARREKAEQAKEEYETVLEFLEESGSAQTKTNNSERNKTEEDEKEEGDYSLEVIEPEL